MATVDPPEIGRRIKRARDKKGWTQLTFALNANVSPSTVARWEAGKLPPIRELMRIAELLGVDADYLVDADPDEATPSADADELAAVRQELQQLRADTALERKRQERMEETLGEIRELLRGQPPAASSGS